MNIQQFNCNNLKDLNYISPYIRRAWDGHMSQGWYLKERCIYDYEMVYIMEGKAIITIGEQKYDASEGELYIFKPGIKHSMKSYPHVRLRQPHIHFDFIYNDLSEKIPVSYSQHENEIKHENESRIQKKRRYFKNQKDFEIPDRIILGEKRDKVEQVFLTIINEWNNPGPLTFLKCKYLMIMILVLILEINLPCMPINKENYLQGNLTNEKLNIVKEYIMQNYSSKISLDELSYVSGLSKNHLIREYKKKFAITPVAFLNEFRIKKAKMFLSSGCYSVKAVSVKVGFSDTNYFCRVFRKYSGETPAQYVKNEKGNEILSF